MKVKYKSTQDSSVIAKKGYVMIEEVEASLHIKTIFFRSRRWWTKTLFNRGKLAQNNKEYSVSVFIASGAKIDTKIDNINRRYKR